VLFLSQHIIVFAGSGFSIPKLWLRDMYTMNGYGPLEVEKWRAWVSNLDLWEKARNIKNKLGR
jgi:hypothetical protein